MTGACGEGRCLLVELVVSDELVVHDALCETGLS